MTGAKTEPGFPIEPPIEPMLAKLADELPAGEGWLFEPKWDGFRAIVFKDRDRIYTQSRDLRPLDRYFPELAPAFVAHLPARCVVAGFRWHKGGENERVGSLLLGLYDSAGRLQHVGVTSSFTADRRRQLAEELAPLRTDALAGHPWRDWAAAADGSSRMPGAQSRWSAGKDLSWEPLRVERVCEVKYDHLQGDRFRHAATFLRWRDRKSVV